MPSRAPHPCAIPRCPIPVASGRYCQTHQRPAPPTHDTTTTEQGYGADWRKLAALVRLEEPFCRTCKAQGRTTPTRDVDHIVPRSQGGSDERGNLQGLCWTHHSQKTRREMNTRGRGIKSLEVHTP